MNKLLSLSVLATTLLLSSCSNAPQEEPLAKVIDRGLKASTEQALLMAKELEQQEGRLPKSIKDGKLETSDCYWWCSGFFPGELWYLYESNPTPELKKYAELFTGRLEKVQHVTDNHDVGFMLYCSYGNGYRLTQNPAYKDVLVTGAGSLSTRFNPMIKAIRSWDFTNNGKWQYPVIIDNMMNLELLTWAIMASALIELSQLDKSDEAKNYLDFAEQQVRSLSSPEYLAEKGTNCNFVLKHSTGHLPGNSEVDVPLSYADYYYVEALMRLKKLI